MTDRIDLASLRVGDKVTLTFEVTRFDAQFVHLKHGDDDQFQLWLNDTYHGTVERAPRPLEASMGDPDWMIPLAVWLAAERVRVDAANTMRHDTTSDLTPRLMCRVGVSDIGLVLAWLDQHRTTENPHA